MHSARQGANFCFGSSGERAHFILAYIARADGDRNVRNLELVQLELELSDDVMVYVNENVALEHGAGRLRFRDTERGLCINSVGSSLRLVARSGAQESNKA